MLRSRWLRVPTTLLLTGFSVWSAMALLYAGGSSQPGALRILVAAIWVVALTYGFGWQREAPATWILCAIGNAFVFAWWASMTPSVDRVWSIEQSRLPRVELDGERVHLRQLRDFDDAGAPEPEWARGQRWYEETFDLSALARAYYVVVPFSIEAKALAHTMVSFEFDDGRCLAVSVEVRKERDESYSPLFGLFRHYEVMYVMGTERDLIGHRARRGDPLYMYPMKASREATREFFLDMLRRAEQLASEPEFYNTLTSTCTTNLVRHLERVSGKGLPFDLRIVFPGYSDRLAFELGLIDTELEFEQARKHFRVDEKVRGIAADADFSVRLRE